MLAFTSWTIIFLMCGLNIKERNLSILYFRTIFLKLGLTPCKAEWPLQGIDLNEKEVQKD